MDDYGVHVHMGWCRNEGHGDDGSCRTEIVNGTTRAAVSGVAGSYMTIEFSGQLDRVEDAEAAVLLLDAARMMYEEYGVQTTPEWLEQMRDQYEQTGDGVWYR